MMDLERLVAAIGAVDVVGGTPVEVRDLAYDTRAVAPGAVFFCVPGARVDGHELAAEAVERGAVALVVERALGVSVPQLRVPDARIAMAAAADAFLRGVERRVAAGLVPDVGSVASVFISRWDAAVTRRVPEALRNQLGIGAKSATLDKAS